MNPKEFINLLQSGSKEKVSGLCGRILRGKSEGDFHTLTDDSSRKVVMLVGPDGLEKLMGKSGYEMLVEIGYEPDYIDQKLKEGTEFRLVVFPEGGSASIATWDNTFSMLYRLYPNIAWKLSNSLEKLKKFYSGFPNPKNAFEALEHKASFSFKDVDASGPHDHRYMTYDRYVSSSDSMTDARAFLYFTVYLKELYSGNGYTYTADGRKGMMEYIVPNLPISDLGPYEMVKLDVKKPTRGMSRPMHKGELPIPVHFNPLNSTKITRVNYQALASSAKTWAKAHNLQPSVSDKKKVCLMAIDCQNTFCLPDGELYVIGAEDDTNRLCEFIYRNLGLISNIAPTMDTHLLMQIFHSMFWINDEGNNPDPGTTIITLDDVESGKWKVNPAVAHGVAGGNYVGLQQHALHYVRKLSSDGKYALLVWPYHAMLGGVGHALTASVEEAIFFHSVARNSQTDFQIKGGNPLTENYSVLRPEVLDDHKGRPIAQKNTHFIKKLLEYDAVAIAGQAKSHCVAWTIQDLLDEINVHDPALVKKIHLIEDCTSPVVIPGVIDFSDQANEIFRKFADAGMNIVKSTDPIEDWPGLR